MKCSVDANITTNQSESILIVTYVTCGCMTVIGLLAIIGNFLSVLAVVVDPSKVLRTPFNYFLVNLSVSDLIVGCGAIPILIVDDLNDPYKGFTNEENMVSHISFFISTCASTLSMIVLVMDRYFAIESPIYYRTKINIKRSYIISISIWIVSIVLSTGYFLLSFKVFNFVSSNVQVFANVAVLIFVYISVSKRLQTQQKQFVQPRTRNVRTFTTTSSLSVPSDNDPQENHIRKLHSRSSLSNADLYLERQNRVMKSFSLLLITVLFCGLPATALNYVIMFCTYCNNFILMIFQRFALVLLLVTSALNPYLLSLRLHQFNRALKGIFCCMQVQSSSGHPPTIKSYKKKKTEKSPNGSKDIILMKKVTNSSFCEIPVNTAVKTVCTISVNTEITLKSEYVGCHA